MDRDAASGAAEDRLAQIELAARGGHRPGPQSTGDEPEDGLELIPAPTRQNGGVLAGLGTNSRQESSLPVLEKGCDRRAAVHRAGLPAGPEMAWASRPAGCFGTARRAAPGLRCGLTAGGAASDDDLRPPSARTDTLPLWREFRPNCGPAGVRLASVRRPQPERRLLGPRYPAEICAHIKRRIQSTDIAPARQHARRPSVVRGWRVAGSPAEGRAALFRRLPASPMNGH